MVNIQQSLPFHEAPITLLDLREGYLTEETLKWMLKETYNMVFTDTINLCLKGVSLWEESNIQMTS